MKNIHKFTQQQFDDEPVTDAEFEQYMMGPADREIDISRVTWHVPVFADVCSSVPIEQKYELPDDLYHSKDWRDGNYAERVEWLHLMYEDSKREIERLQDSIFLLQEAERKRNP